MDESAAVDRALRSRDTPKRRQGRSRAAFRKVHVLAGPPSANGAWAMTLSIEAKTADDPFERRVVAAQLRAHYAQIPAMAIAPTVGGFFTAWVLWGAVENRYLVIGVSAVALQIGRAHV